MRKLAPIVLIFLFWGYTSKAQINIVCIGNSITHGKVEGEIYRNTSIGDSINQMSYRFRLWEKLDSAGYDVKFTGFNSTYYRQKTYENIVSKSRYTGHTFSNQSEGYYGINTTQFNQGGWREYPGGLPPFTSRIKKYEVDAALIHLGTVDKKTDIVIVERNIKRTVRILRKKNPEVTIFLARLITDWIPISHQMEQIASKLSSEKSKVIFVDLATGFINAPQLSNAMTTDWVHPNAVGVEFMTDRWYNAMTPWLDGFTREEEIVMKKTSSKKTNIVCIGNSITQGKTNRGLFHNTSIGDSLAEMSYRFYLWEKLDSAGYAVDFVGFNNKYFLQEPQDTIVSISRYTNNVFSNDNEAYYGIKSGDFIEGKWNQNIGGIPKFTDRVKTYNPEIALIHIGSNDVNMDTTYSEKSIKEIVQVLRKRNSYVTVVIARLITDDVYVSTKIEALVNDLSTKKSKVIFVDMADGFINSPKADNTMTFDGVHPNSEGQVFMAKKWYDTIQPIMESNRRTSDKKWYIKIFTIDSYRKLRKSNKLR